MKPDQSPVRILLLADNPADVALVRTLLDQEGLRHELQPVQTGDEFRAALRSHRFDLIISDYSLSAFDGLSALGLREKEAPEVPFLLFSGTLGEEHAVRSIQQGATDYLVKNRKERLGPAVRRALAHARERNALKQTQDELQRRDQLLRSITDNLEDLIAVVDLNGRRVFNSPSYRHLLDEVQTRVGTDSFADVHPDDRERVKRTFRETTLTGIGQRTEYRFLAKDCTVHHVESQGSVMRDLHGNIVNLLLVSRDVTERKQREDRLLEQAALLDMAREAIYVMSVGGLITYWNKAAEQLYGYPSVEVLTRRATDILARAGSTEFAEFTEKVLRVGECSGEIHRVTRDGKEIIVESRWSLVRYGDGNPRAALIIDTDITAKKGFETQFRRAQRLESIGQLASGIAHDLNNILSPILISAQMLRLGLDKESLDTTIVTLETSAQRGANLVKQLLSFGRGLDGQRVTVQFKHLVRELIKIARETFPRNITVESKYPNDLWPLQGDPNHLHQVFLNLLLNSRDAMPDGGTLTVRAANVHLAADDSLVAVEGKPGPHVVVSVEDTGHGIPIEFIDHIFDPFFTRKENGKGTGLGLSTALGIVKSHGGFFRVRSQPSKGTSFEVYLPAAPENQPDQDDQSAVAPPDGRGETVLVVDDDKAVLNTCQRTLEAHGYKVMAASDGIEALNLYAHRQKEIDVVLTDLMMPSLDGAGLVRALRRMDPQVKIIGASGLGSRSEYKDLIDDARRAGITEVLEKPYTTEKLLSELHRALHGNR